MVEPMKPHLRPARNLSARFIIIALLGLVGCTTPDKTTDASTALKLEISNSPLTVKFINTSAQPIKISKPLDGSEHCWIMPHYKLMVTDHQGRPVPLSGRCGLYGFPEGSTRLPDNYLVTIPPGASYSRQLELTHDIPKSGMYKLCFHYVFYPGNNNRPDHRYPRGLWSGEVTSNTIEAHLEAKKQE